MANLESKKDSFVAGLVSAGWSEKGSIRKVVSEQ
jgi:hypothetical protein